MSFPYRRVKDPKFIEITGFTLAGVAIAVASVQVMRHYCTHYKSKDVKNCIIRLISFLIFYSVDAIASMYVAMLFRHGEDVQEDELPWYKHLAGVLKASREVYECVVVLAFVTLILDYLGGASRVGKKIEEEWRRNGEIVRPRNPLIFGGKFGQRFLCCFHWFYRPGLSMLCTILLGVVQFSFVLLCTTFVDVVVLLNDLEDDPVGKVISKGTKILKIVSTTLAMYNIFMLHEVLEENSKLNPTPSEAMEGTFPYSKMRPEPKFLFFKIPIIATMQLDVVAKFLFKDGSEEVLVTNFVISSIMCLFAIFSIWAFPPSELNHVTDKHPSESYSHAWEMLKDIRRLKQKAKKRRAVAREVLAPANGESMQGLVQSHNDRMLLDIDRDGKLEKEEFMYLCEVARIACDPLNFEPIDLMLPPALDTRLLDQT